ncbi:MAG: efflux RND transporter periplasmic adaptor subunit [Rubrivivax sp.]|nr:efflux RND transporter periplasmic adaptor subunit [Rubrivivax sp.]
MRELTFSSRSLPCGLVLLVALLASACGPRSAPASGTSKSAATEPAAASLLVAPEDLLTLQPSRIAQGPVVSGAVQPGKRADLRAEVAAVVMQVLKDNGEPVRAGDLLMKLDDTAIRDSLSSAEEALRAATQAQDQVERTVQRLSTLREQGMTSAQALEDAQVRRNQAQSDVVAARSRVATASQQLARTLVRAPFDGVVSERRASAGDTAQIGKELLKVIDPRSMRFEGLVSADRLQDLKIGQPVSFRVNGFTDQAFAGRVQRIDSAVNTATRQVAVVVSFNDPGQAPRVAGLFAEGRIESGSVQGLSLPASTLRGSGDQTFVWRVQDQRVTRTRVQMGERDARTGEVAVLGGLSAGDRVLRHPGSNLNDGQAVTLVAAAAANLAASAAVRSPAAPAAASAPATARP